MAWFETELGAVDPYSADEKPNIHHYAGPPIKADSFNQAVEICRLTKPYLKVIGMLGNPDPETMQCQAKVYSSRADQVPPPQDIDGKYNGPVEQVGQEDEQEELQEGDLVILKSGGPLVTIKDVGAYECTVQYFVGLELYEIQAHTNSLILAYR